MFITLECQAWIIAEAGDITTAEIASRAKVRGPLAALEGAATLTLRSEGGGRPVKGDPRTLNFRVFTAS